MSEKKHEVFQLCAGEVSCWCEQGSSVHIKAAAKSGDPVELTGEEAIKLADALVKAAMKID